MTCSLKSLSHAPVGPLLVTCIWSHGTNVSCFELASQPHDGARGEQTLLTSRGPVRRSPPPRSPLRLTKILQTFLRSAIRKEDSPPVHGVREGSSGLCPPAAVRSARHRLWQRPPTWPFDSATFAACPRPMEARSISGLSTLVIVSSSVLLPEVFPPLPAILVEKYRSRTSWFMPTDLAIELQGSVQVPSKGFPRKTGLCLACGVGGEAGGTEKARSQDAPSNPSCSPPPTLLPPPSPRPEPKCKGATVTRREASPDVLKEIRAPCHHVLSPSHQGTSRN